MNNMEDTYKQVKTIVNKRIKDGSLPKEYKLPALSTFTKPDTKDIPNPDYIFVPMGLTFTQWDKLLKNVCEGEWHSSGFPDDFNKGSGWELWAISGDPKPSIVNISKEQAVEKGYTLAPLQALIAQQWQRLEQGLEPVDKETWTLAQEDIEVDGSLRSVYQRFNPNRRTVCSLWYSRGYAYGYGGVRPSARGNSKFLNLETSSNSSDLSAVEANTEALNRLTDTLEKVFKI